MYPHFRRPSIKPRPADPRLREAGAPGHGPASRPHFLLIGLGLLFAVSGCFDFSELEAAEEGPSAPPSTSSSQFVDTSPMASTSGSPTPDTSPSTEDRVRVAGRVWESPIETWPGALLSVTGRADDDVWIVGAAVEEEATILHWNGEVWTRHYSGFEDDLWWVHVIDEDQLLLGGARGTILHFSRGEFRRLPTRGLARETVYGVWADSMSNIWAVGGIGARSGFIWHGDGEDWTSLRLPSELPLRPNGATNAMLKVTGTPDGGVLVVGGGAVLEATTPNRISLLSLVNTDSLFTVSVSDEGEGIAVGGGPEAMIAGVGGEVQYREEALPLLQGIAFGPDSIPWATGAFGTVLRRTQTGWEDVPHGLAANVESLHAVWVSPTGAVWAVGGNVLSSDLDRGVLIHGAPAGISAPAALTWEIQSEAAPQCPALVPGPEGTRTIARVWNEVTLNAIRRALPEPTVHARNLYHVSLVIHDVWSHLREDRSALIYSEDITLGIEVFAEAVSYAVQTLLIHRYAERTGGEVTERCVHEQMEALGLDPAFHDRNSMTPAGFGLRLGDAIIDYFRSDGSLESLDYTDPRYAPRNPPLRVDEPGVDLLDPSSWQELIIARAMTQNGIPEPSGPITYIGPHWGGVTPFAIRRPDFGETYFPLGERPEVHRPWLVDEVVDVIRKTSLLAPSEDSVIDISPGGYGNNSVGADDGNGHPMNPSTGAPYAQQLVPLGDFTRVLAEYWADGPDSETPPGHWNVIANRAFDHPEFQHRFYGEGPQVDRLTWDVQAHLILNGALHDAAIVAWEAKREYESARPISLIRWMAGNGQRTDPGLPSYDPDGLPLVEGLIELITEASSAPGERHEALHRHVDEIAIWTWPGEPGDYRLERSEMRWVRGVEWMPYQPRTFVTPAFPGYVSGHSTFSHAAARTLERLTGSPFFPGGLGEFVAEQNAYLEFEAGPSVEVRLQWATWRDAADQAGQSRIWGGIHVAADDYDGRVLGWQVGDEAGSWGARHVAGFQPLPTIGDPTNPIHGGALESDLEGEPGDPPVGDPGVLVGTGRTQWSALLQGDPLRWEGGPQGGHHVWAAMRIEAAVAAELDPAARQVLRTRFTVEWPEEDGEILAQAQRTGGWTEGADGSIELVGTFVPLLSTIDVNSLTGRTLKLRAQVTIDDDRTLSSHVHFRSLCCD